MRPCNRRGCGVLVESGYCPAHKPEEKPRLDEPWRALYRTVEWFKARAHVRSRDGGQCQAIRNGAPCENLGTEVHHRTKLRDLWEMYPEWVDFLQAATDPSVLILLCPTCHRIVDTATTNDEVADSTD